MLASMSYSGLPTELLPQVFEELSCNDLLAVSLVSRTFQHEGQRIIFRHSGHLVLGPDVQSTGARFLDAITNSPHRLALSVHYLGLQLRLSQPERRIVTLVRKLERALVLLVTLKTLKISGSTAHLPHPLNPIPHTLLKCTFQLHTFEWQFGGDELLTSEFIRQQRGIVDLTFSGSIGFDMKVLNGLGRQLESLSAPMVVAAAVMKGVGHSLTYLRCTDLDHVHDFIPAPAAELLALLSGVRVLHYDHDGVFVGPSLSDMADSLRKITLLRLRLYNARFVTQEYYDTLSRLPTLQKLILRVPHIYNYNVLDSIAENVFSYCPNLQYMDVQTETGRSHTERYTRIPGQSGYQSQTLMSSEEEYSWNRRWNFIGGN